MPAPMRRNDGVIVDAPTTRDIDKRVDYAEFMSFKTTGSQGGWHKHYGPESDRDLDDFKRDFRWMRAEIDRLRTRLSDANYKLESLGEKEE